MSKHTPGPWSSVDKKRGPKRSVWAGESVEQTETDWGAKDGRPSRYGPTRVYIANALAGFHISEEEATANARLIAAAPDLLEQLVRVYAHHCETECHGRAKSGCNCRVFDGVRSVLSALKGES